MTTIENGAQSALTFPLDRRVRITDLQTHQDDLSPQYIAAQVVLIWPYSSSTRKFSLLLSEPDARPLKGRKQVKVNFLNGAARAAQESHVGIGDEIRLQLEGCQWVQTDDAISTPGKRVDGDIQFRKYLAFEIQSKQSPPQQVLYQSTGTPSPVTSPAVNGILETTQDLQTGSSKISIPYSSPAIRKDNRTSSGSYLDSPLDPFSEDKDYVYGRSRKRTKFARPSSDWKLIDDDELEVIELATPSKAREPESIQQPEATVEEPEMVEAQCTPEIVDLTSPVVETFDSASVNISTTLSQLTGVTQDSRKEFTETASTLMKPPETPARPSRRQKPTYIELEDHAEHSHAISTPRLIPMPSPSLPLVSPLIRHSGVEVGYFPSGGTTVSELDAMGQFEQDAREVRRSSTSSRSMTSTSDDSLVIVDARPKRGQVPIPPGAVGADIVEDEDMYGASQPPKRVDEFEIQTTQRSRDALDVLEEFLQMSPTRPEEAVRVEIDRGLEVRDHVEAEADHHRQPKLSPAQIESSDPPVEQLKSPRLRPLPAATEGEEQELRRQSRSISLDGAMDDEHNEAPDQSSTMRNNLPDYSYQDRQATPDSLPEVSRRIQVEVKPVMDEAARSLRSRQIQLPLTPSQTQEAPADVDLARTRPEDMSVLPTPDNTQDQEELPSSQVVPSQENLAVEGTEEITTLKDAETQKARRASERPSRKSITTSNISSPYFTPRRPQKAPRSSPAREKTPVPSSPPTESPSSPTRPVTRSQRAASKLSSPPVVEDHIAEMEASSSAQSEVAQGLDSKSGTTTSISYYAPLASLSQHFGESIDIIAVVVDESTKPERAKSGPKDHYTILRLVDPSLDSKTRTTVQIFRPDRLALPSARRGDVVILRNFKPQTVKHKWILNSSDVSAWAVFTVNPSLRSMFDNVAISGPPVEYARGETAQVKKLVQWWQTQGAASFPVSGKKATSEKVERNGQSIAQQPQSKDTEEVMESVEPPPLSPRRTRRRNNMTDNSGNDEDPMSSPFGPRDTTSLTSVRHQPSRRAKSKTPAVNGNSGTDAEKTSPAVKRANTPSKRGNSPTKSARKSPGVVHELRDGTKYVDDGKNKSGSVVHELRDGRNYVDE